MVIGNNEASAGSGSHLFLANGLRQTRDPFEGPARRIFSVQLSSDGRSHASAQSCHAAKRLIRLICAPQYVECRSTIRCLKCSSPPEHGSAQGQKSYWERF